MSDPDTHDPCEFLIQHAPLSDVLAFASARSEVHDIVEVDAPASSSAADTQPAPAEKWPTLTEDDWWMITQFKGGEKPEHVEVDAPITYQLTLPFGASSST